MCLILFAYRTNATRPLVVAANRDEFYERPAREAHWWHHAGTDGAGIELFGGRDLQAGGAWLAVARDGRFAAVTNWSERPTPPAPASRGDLARDFLADAETARDFAGSIEGDLYNGFNLLLFDGEEMIYASNRSGELKALEPGVYGLTNTWLGDRWPKAVHGARALSQAAAHASPRELIALLARPHLPVARAYDGDLQPERSFSPCFITGDHYGTRASTVVIATDRRVAFTEQHYGPHGVPGGRVEEEFDIVPSRVALRMD